MATLNKNVVIDSSFLYLNNLDSQAIGTDPYVMTIEYEVPSTLSEEDLLKQFNHTELTTNDGRLFTHELVYEREGDTSSPITAIRYSIEMNNDDTDGVIIQTNQAYYDPDTMFYKNASTATYSTVPADDTSTPITLLTGSVDGIDLPTQTVNIDPSDGSSTANFLITAPLTEPTETPLTLTFTSYEAPDITSISYMDYIYDAASKTYSAKWTSLDLTDAAVGTDTYSITLPDNANLAKGTLFNVQIAEEYQEVGFYTFKIEDAAANTLFEMNDDETYSYQYVTDTYRMFSEYYETPAFGPADTEGFHTVNLEVIYYDDLDIVSLYTEGELKFSNDNVLSGPFTDAAGKQLYLITSEQLDSIDNGEFDLLTSETDVTYGNLYTNSNEAAEALTDVLTVGTSTTTLNDLFELAAAKDSSVSTTDYTLSDYQNDIDSTYVDFNRSAFSDANESGLATFNPESFPDAIPNAFIFIYTDATLSFSEGDDVIGPIEDGSSKFYVLTPEQIDQIKAGERELFTDDTSKISFQSLIIDNKAQLEAFDDVLSSATTKDDLLSVLSGDENTAYRFGEDSTVVMQFKEGEIGSGKTITITAPMGATRAEYYDGDGNPLELSIAADGTITLNVDDFLSVDSYSNQQTVEVYFFDDDWNDLSIQSIYLDIEPELGTQISSDINSLDTPENMTVNGDEVTINLDSLFNFFDISAEVNYASAFFPVVDKDGNPLLSVDPIEFLSDYTFKDGNGNVLTPIVHTTEDGTSGYIYTFENIDGKNLLQVSTSIDNYEENYEGLFDSAVVTIYETDQQMIDRLQQLSQNLLEPTDPNAQGVGEQILNILRYETDSNSAVIDEIDLPRPPEYENTAPELHIDLVDTAADLSSVDLISIELPTGVSIETVRLADFSLQNVTDESTLEIANSGSFSKTDTVTTKFVLNDSAKDYFSANSSPNADLDIKLEEIIGSQDIPISIKLLDSAGNVIGTKELTQKVLPSADYTIDPYLSGDTFSSDADATGFYTVIHPQLTEIESDEYLGVFSDGELQLDNGETIAGPFGDPKFYVLTPTQLLQIDQGAKLLSSDNSKIAFQLLDVDAEKRSDFDAALKNPSTTYQDLAGVFKSDSEISQSSAQQIKVIDLADHGTLMLDGVPESTTIEIVNVVTGDLLTLSAAEYSADASGNATLDISSIIGDPSNNDFLQVTYIGSDGYRFGSANYVLDNANVRAVSDSADTPLTLIEGTSETFATPLPFTANQEIFVHVEIDPITAIEFGSYTDTGEFRAYDTSKTEGPDGKTGYLVDRSNNLLDDQQIVFKLNQEDTSFVTSSKDISVDLTFYNVTLNSDDTRSYTDGESQHFDIEVSPTTRDMLSSSNEAILKMDDGFEGYKVNIGVPANETSLNNEYLQLNTVDTNEIKLVQIDDDVTPPKIINESTIIKISNGDGTVTYHLTPDQATDVYSGVYTVNASESANVTISSLDVDFEQRDQFESALQTAADQGVPFVMPDGIVFTQSGSITLLAPSDVDTDPHQAPDEIVLVPDFSIDDGVEVSVVNILNAGGELELPPLTHFMLSEITDEAGNPIDGAKFLYVPYAHLPDQHAEVTDQMLAVGLSPEQFKSLYLFVPDEYVTGGGESQAKFSVEMKYQDPSTGQMTSLSIDDVVVTVKDNDDEVSTDVGDLGVSNPTITVEPIAMFDGETAPVVINLSNIPDDADFFVSALPDSQGRVPQFQYEMNPGDSATLTTLEVPNPGETPTSLTAAQLATLQITLADDALIDGDTLSSSFLIAAKSATGDSITSAFATLDITDDDQVITLSNVLYEQNSFNSNPIQLTLANLSPTETVSVTLPEWANELESIEATTDGANPISYNQFSTSIDGDGNKVYQFNVGTDQFNELKILLNGQIGGSEDLPITLEFLDTSGNSVEQHNYVQKILPQANFLDGLDATNSAFSETSDTEGYFSVDSDLFTSVFTSGEYLKVYSDGELKLSDGSPLAGPFESDGYYILTPGQIGEIVSGDLSLLTNDDTEIMLQSLDPDVELREAFNEALISTDAQTAVPKLLAEQPELYSQSETNYILMQNSPSGIESFSIEDMPAGTSKINIFNPNDFSVPAVQVTDSTAVDIDISSLSDGDNSQLLLVQFYDSGNNPLGVSNYIIKNDPTPVDDSSTTVGDGYLTAVLPGFEAEVAGDIPYYFNIIPDSKIIVQGDSGPVEIELSNIMEVENAQDIGGGLKVYAFKPYDFNPKLALTFYNDQSGVEVKLPDFELLIPDDGTGSKEYTIVQTSANLISKEFSSSSSRITTHGTDQSSITTAARASTEDDMQPLYFQYTGGNENIASLHIEGIESGTTFSIKYDINGDGSFMPDVYLKPSGESLDLTAGMKYYGDSQATQPLGTLDLSVSEILDKLSYTLAPGSSKNLDWTFTGQDSDGNELPAGSLVTRVEAEIDSDVDISSQLYAINEAIDDAMTATNEAIQFVDISNMFTVNNIDTKDFYTLNFMQNIGGQSANTLDDSLTLVVKYTDSTNSTLPPEIYEVGNAADTGMYVLSSEVLQGIKDGTLSLGFDVDTSSSSITTAPQFTLVARTADDDYVDFDISNIESVSEFNNELKFTSVSNGTARVDISINTVQNTIVTSNSISTNENNAVQLSIAFDNGGDTNEIVTGVELSLEDGSTAELWLGNPADQTSVQLEEVNGYYQVPDAGGYRLLTKDEMMSNVYLKPGADDSSDQVVGVRGHYTDNGQIAKDTDGNVTYIESSIPVVVHELALDAATREGGSIYEGESYAASELYDFSAMGDNEVAILTNGKGEQLVADKAYIDHTLKLGSDIADSDNTGFYKIQFFAVDDDVELVDEGGNSITLSGMTADKIIAQANNPDSGIVAGAEGTLSFTVIPTLNTVMTVSYDSSVAAMPGQEIRMAVSFTYTGQNKLDPNETVLDVSVKVADENNDTFKVGGSELTVNSEGELVFASGDLEGTLPTAEMMKTFTVISYDGTAPTLSIAPKHIEDNGEIRELTPTEIDSITKTITPTLQQPTVDVDVDDTPPISTPTTGDSTMSIQLNINTGNVLEDYSGQLIRDVALVAIDDADPSIAPIPQTITKATLQLSTASGEEYSWLRIVDDTVIPNIVVKEPIFLDASGELVIEPGMEINIGGETVSFATVEEYLELLQAAQQADSSVNVPVKLKLEYTDGNGATQTYPAADSGEEWSTVVFEVNPTAGEMISLSSEEALTPNTLVSGMYDLSNQYADNAEAGEYLEITVESSTQDARLATDPAIENVMHTAEAYTYLVPRDAAYNLKIFAPNEASVTIKYIDPDAEGVQILSDWLDLNPNDRKETYEKILSKITYSQSGPTSLNTADAGTVDQPQGDSGTGTESDAGNNNDPTVTDFGFEMIIKDASGTQFNEDSEVNLGLQITGVDADESLVAINITVHDESNIADLINASALNFDSDYYSSVSQVTLSTAEMQSYLEDADQYAAQQTTSDIEWTANYIRVHNATTVNGDDYTIITESFSKKTLASDDSVESTDNVLRVHINDADGNPINTADLYGSGIVESMNIVGLTEDVTVTVSSQVEEAGVLSDPISAGSTSFDIASPDEVDTGGPEVVQDQNISMNINAPWVVVEDEASQFLQLSFENTTDPTQDVTVDQITLTFANDEATFQLMRPSDDPSQEPELLTLDLNTDNKLVLDKDHLSFTFDSGHEVTFSNVEELLSAIAITPPADSSQNVPVKIESVVSTNGQTIPMEVHDHMIDVHSSAANVPQLGPDEEGLVRMGEDGDITQYRFSDEYGNALEQGEYLLLETNATELNDGTGGNVFEPVYVDGDTKTYLIPKDLAAGIVVEAPTDTAQDTYVNVNNMDPDAESVATLDAWLANTGDKVEWPDLLSSIDFDTSDTRSDLHPNVVEPKPVTYFDGEYIDVDVSGIILNDFDMGTSYNLGPVFDDNFDIIESVTYNYTDGDGKDQEVNGYSQLPALTAEELQTLHITIPDEYKEQFDDGLMHLHANSADRGQVNLLFDVDGNMIPVSAYEIEQLSDGDNPIAGAKYSYVDSVGTLHSDLDFETLPESFSAAELASLRVSTPDDYADELGVKSSYLEIRTADGDNLGSSFYNIFDNEYEANSTVHDIKLPGFADLNLSDLYNSDGSPADISINLSISDIHWNSTLDIDGNLFNLAESGSVDGQVIKIIPSDTSLNPVYAMMNTSGVDEGKTSLTIELVTEQELRDEIISDFSERNPDDSTPSESEINQMLADYVTITSDESVLTDNMNLSSRVPNQMTELSFSQSIDIYELIESQDYPGASEERAVSSEEHNLDVLLLNDGPDPVSVTVVTPILEEDQVGIDASDMPQVLTLDGYSIADLDTTNIKQGDVEISTIESLQADSSRDITADISFNLVNDATSDSIAVSQSVKITVVPTIAAGAISEDQNADVTVDANDTNSYGISLSSMTFTPGEADFVMIGFMKDAAGDLMGLPEGVTINSVDFSKVMSLMGDDDAGSSNQQPAMFMITEFDADGHPILPISVDPTVQNFEITNFAGMAMDFDDDVMLRLEDVIGKMLNVFVKFTDGTINGEAPASDFPGLLQQFGSLPPAVFGELESLIGGDSADSLFDSAEGLMVAVMDSLPSDSGVTDFESLLTYYVNNPGAHDGIKAAYDTAIDADPTLAAAQDQLMDGLNTLFNAISGPDADINKGSVLDLLDVFTPDDIATITDLIGGGDPFADMEMGEEMMAMLMGAPNSVVVNLEGVVDGGPVVGDDTSGSGGPVVGDDTSGSDGPVVGDDTSGSGGPVAGGGATTPVAPKQIDLGPQAAPTGNVVVDYDRVKAHNADGSVKMVGDQIIYLTADGEELPALNANQSEMLVMLVEKDDAAVLDADSDNDLVADATYTVEEVSNGPTTFLKYMFTSEPGHRVDIDEAKFFVGKNAVEIEGHQIDFQVAIVAVTKNNAGQIIGRSEFKMYNEQITFGETIQSTIHTVQEITEDQPFFAVAVNTHGDSGEVVTSLELSDLTAGATLSIESADGHDTFDGLAEISIVQNAAGGYEATIDGAVVEVNIDSLIINPLPDSNENISYNINANIRDTNGKEQLIDQVANVEVLSQVDAPIFNLVTKVDEGQFVSLKDVIGVSDTDGSEYIKHVDMKLLTDVDIDFYIATGDGKYMPLQDFANAGFDEQIEINHDTGQYSFNNISFDNIFIGGRYDPVSKTYDKNFDQALRFETSVTVADVDKDTLDDQGNPIETVGAPVTQVIDIEFNPLLDTMISVTSGSGAVDQATDLGIELGWGADGADANEVVDSITVNFNTTWGMTDAADLPDLVDAAGNVIDPSVYNVTKEVIDVTDGEGNITQQASYTLSHVDGDNLNDGGDNVAVINDLHIKAPQIGEMGVEVTFTGHHQDVGINYDGSDVSYVDQAFSETVSSTINITQELDTGFGSSIDAQTNTGDPVEASSSSSTQTGDNSFLGGMFGSEVADADVTSDSTQAVSTSSSDIVSSDELNIIDYDEDAVNELIHSSNDIDPAPEETTGNADLDSGPVDDDQSAVS